MPCLSLSMGKHCTYQCNQCCTYNNIYFSIIYRSKTYICLCTNIEPIPSTKPLHPALSTLVTLGSTRRQARDIEFNQVCKRSIYIYCMLLLFAASLITAHAVSSSILRKNKPKGGLIRLHIESCIVTFAAPTSPASSTRCLGLGDELCLTLDDFIVNFKIPPPPPPQHPSTHDKDQEAFTHPKITASISGVRVTERIWMSEYKHRKIPSDTTCVVDDSGSDSDVDERHNPLEQEQDHRHQEPACGHYVEYPLINMSCKSFYDEYSIGGESMKAYSYKGDRPHSSAWSDAEINVKPNVEVVLQSKHDSMSGKDMLDSLDITLQHMQVHVCYQRLHVWTNIFTSLFPVQSQTSTQIDIKFRLVVESMNILVYIPQSISKAQASPTTSVAPPPSNVSKFDELWHQCLSAIGLTANDDWVNKRWRKKSCKGTALSHAVENMHHNGSKVVKGQEYASLTSGCFRVYVQRLVVCSGSSGEKGSTTNY